MAVSAAPALERAVRHALQFHNHDDAVFLAERLNAEAGTDESVFLLGTCYYVSGQPERTFAVLKGRPSADCRFLFAKACLDLKRFHDGELALTGAMFPGSHCDILDADHTHGAAYALLGDICRQNNRMEQAAECYRKSIAQNPFNFTAAQRLYELLGPTGSPDPAKVFVAANVPDVIKTPDPEAAPALSFAGPARTPAQAASRARSLAPTAMMFHTPARAQQNTTPGSVSVMTPGPFVFSALATPGVVTPGGTPTTVPLCQLAGSGTSVPTISALGTPPPMSFVTPEHSAQPRAPPQVAPQAKMQKAPRKQRMQRDLDDKPVRGTRRSSRLESAQAAAKDPQKKARLNTGSTLSSTAPASAAETPAAPSPRARRKTGSRAAGVTGATGAGSGEAPRSPGRFRAPRIQPQTPNPTPAASLAADILAQSVDAALAILRRFGAAVRHLALYECAEAVAVLRQLPIEHCHTGWVQCCIGRAFFEVADYKMADQAFRMGRRVEPHRAEGMDIYSSVLWHLNCHSALSFLSHEVHACSKLRPEPWIAVGNCFSLEKDHDLAVKFFGRAIQVGSDPVAERLGLVLWSWLTPMGLRVTPAQIDPNHAYAYTLLGHELVYKEDFSGAVSSFRSAIRISPRLYNAWYGLAMVYYRQQRFLEATSYLKKALAIHPRNVVLLCYLGLAVHAQGHSKPALALFDQALQRSPAHPLVMFHRAKTLFKMGSLDAALAQAQQLREVAPRESSVYFLLANINQRLSKPDKAMFFFSWASDLDPRGASNLLDKAEQGDIVPEQPDGQGDADGDAEGGEAQLDASAIDPDADLSFQS